MKKCTICFELKCLELFYKDKRAKDGRYSCCKLCTDKRNKKWRDENPEKALEKSRRSHERHKDKDRLRSREYARNLRKNNPEKYKKNKEKWEKENPEKAKEIRKKAIKKWSDLNRVYLNEKNRLWRETNRDAWKEYQRKAAKLQRIKYPEKNAARKIVSGAIQLGILIRPINCSRCLKECKPEGHHPDYSRPLVVVWLCKKCHVEEHRK